MKIKRLLPVVGMVLLGVAAIVTSCEEENDYNFKNIDPGKQEISGPELIYTGEPYVFKALTRGGSTYQWEKVSGDYTLTADGYKATVISNANANGTGVIKVTETTMGGKVGIPAEVTFDISLFCQLDMSKFVGEFTCDEEGYGAYGVNLTRVEGENAVLNDNFWDWAAPGQVIKYELSGDFSQVVTVPLQDFIFGDESAGTVEGSGTYNGCTGEMVVDYIVVYDGAENETHHVFTPGAPPATKSTLTLKKGK